ncbi:heme-binding protein [Sphingomonas sp. BIUV-7]|uniref:Heme-binding protein n=1 Tax=Sphingomonas natans TaxID=3063330 RepID=A0ABT8Y5K9_9SPHN|nr:heme-binding protein [Sphingomonas sp. BIUV-7]MDO6412950.1 heme-binding protein [Sphingomonas sp. BIUV-7]
MSLGRRLIGAVVGCAFLLSSCGGGGGSSTTATSTDTSTGTSTPTGNNFTAPAQEALTTADVGRILSQAATEATARGMPSVIAVSDRVGNILAVYNMTGARPTATIPLPATGTGLDVQGATIPAGGGAIAKAVTAAYLSSSGNAFTTRTASQIVQQHFPPAPTTVGLESGPLFGVQFSQLPCSDLSSRYIATGGSAALIGPKRSPLGLSADPGGIPLYKNGVLVGGIGVMGDGVYGLDANTLDVDVDNEEYIALAGTSGFQAPEGITADKITVDGTTLRFIDAVASGLKSNPAQAPAFASLTSGQLVSVRGYFAETGTPALVAGQAYGTEASGIRASTAAEFSNRDAFVLSDGAGNDRFPVIGATDAGDVAQPLTQTEVRTILEEAFTIMTRARGQIRRPLDSRAQVSITVVDTRGNSLGLVRSPDAPIFGTDVALQKARTAAFFSSAKAGTDLAADPSADVRGLAAAERAFLGDQSSQLGKFAYTDRAHGLVSRPYFPDGEVGRPNGPFSRPIAQWSPFSTGLQTALILNNLVAHLGYVQGAATDTPQRCTNLPVTPSGKSRLANGIQIFPGSVPIYRGSTLIGGIGVSGDGIDQDDMISFLGLNNAGAKLNTGVGNAPAAIRSDQVVVALGDKSVRLRYVGCPFAPFLDSSDQDACGGK